MEWPEGTLTSCLYILTALFVALCLAKVAEVLVLSPAGFALPRVLLANLTTTRRPSEPLNSLRPEGTFAPAITSSGRRRGLVVAAAVVVFAVATTFILPEDEDQNEERADEGLQHSRATGCRLETSPRRPRANLARPKQQATCSI